MAKYVIDDTTLIAIADEVRRLTGYEGELTPNEMAVLLREVEVGSSESWDESYSSGYSDGYNDGWDQGYNDGWDSGYGEGWSDCESMYNFEDVPTEDPPDEGTTICDACDREYDSSLERCPDCYPEE